MDLYRIPTQKTYQGKTAGGYLENAKIAEMKSGDFEITTPDLPGCVLIMADDGDLVISNFDGRVCALETSKRALEKLKTFQSQIEDMHNDQASRDSK